MVVLLFMSEVYPLVSKASLSWDNLKKLLKDPIILSSHIYIHVDSKQVELVKL